jgi:flagella basal body P-ring formation protein FlgA
MGLLQMALAACLAVSAVSDHIRAVDLAPASETFAALDPATVIGLAPAPGVRRVFSVAELRRIAARFGAQSAPETGLCVERKTALLDPAQLLAALQAGAPAVNLKLLDFSRAPVPEGELVFPRSGLRRAPGSAYFWNGWVRYAAGRRFSVWAKIEAHAPGPVVVAAVNLKPGQAIEAAQLRLEIRDEPFASGLVTLDLAIGQVARRPVRSGAALEPQWLEQSPDVARGDPVKVDVWSGAAHLQLDARAESAAAAGQPVLVRNPATQKKFLARVESKGQVSVGSAPRAKEKP